MKKVLALAAVAALATGVSAYAANPFSDVSTEDWAYQAVSTLSDQGVVEGYPDGTFRGERNMTRYELAQIIARLMAREDQLDAEQQGMINRLAAEYADELANLGVRVSNLEKKVGNISWSGNARMRFNQGYEFKELKSNDPAAPKWEANAKDNWNGRVQIKAKADVSDNTYVAARFRANMNFLDGESTNVDVPRIVVHHQFSDDFGLTLGREDVYLGQTGLFYDDEFAGAIATIGKEKVALDVGYGRFYNIVTGKYSDPEAMFARLYGDVNAVSYDVEYLDFAGKDADQFIGGGLTLALGDKVSVFGDYYRNLEQDGDPDAWTAGIGFGKVHLAKPGSFRIAAQYLDVEQGGIFADMATYTVAPLNMVFPVNGVHNGEKQIDYWLATADVVLQKNLRLHGEYAFNVDAESDIDYDNLATVSLNYVF